MTNKTQWQHCGKHDKNFSEEIPCPGCENEKYLETVRPAEEKEEQKKKAAK